ncbi:MAG: hypothetical protein K2X09_00415, partial [Rickettsiales bacterium]|nr:hypothetical protein [Rickettsiales bacterium]
MIDQYLTFAHELADVAGSIIRPYFGAHGAVESKSDESPVTIADREAEAAMRERIEERYPEHAIYGEEFGLQLAASAVVTAGSSTAYTWVIDPIDGTRAFIAGRKEWGTLIALCENGIPILGILDQPVTGERWVGMRGQPSVYSVVPAQELDPRKRGREVTIKTRPCASLSDAELSTTSTAYFTPTQAARVVKLAQSSRATVKDGDC